MLGKRTTDLNRWRLSSQNGDHHWRYLSQSESEKQGQSTAERYLLGLPVSPLDDNRPPQSFDAAAKKGFLFFAHLQLDEGHWACDYGGPSFLLPGLIFAMYITDTTIPEEWKVEMTRYLAHYTNEDGGWGLHLEGESTVFATGLYYVMLRLLDMDKNDPLAMKARNRLLALGTQVIRLPT